MTDHDHAEYQDVDERLEGIYEKAYELVQECQYRSATRLANEMRRLAKSEQRIIAYMNSCFLVMNHSSDLLEPEKSRDCAIELISLLESEDRARTIQPDLPESEYSETVAWMTACAYDNLAKATGELNGFNSDGMHQCIGDGILVCRRTGKLECITCFREYATDVYRAADDLDMALHFARVGMSHQDGPHDRRWIGATNAAQLLLLRGEIDSAVEMIDQAWELADTYHTPQYARLKTWLLQCELNHLLGKSDENPPLDEADQPPRGELPWFELMRDQVEAVGACCTGDYSRAIESLEKWDRLLTLRNSLHEWFIHRLRLLSVHRLAGNDRQLQRLGDQLAEKARNARDWLTLRCLKQVLDPAAAAAPVPVVAELRSGLFAPTSSAHSTSALITDDTDTVTDSDSEVAAESVPDGDVPAANARPEPTARVQQFWARMAEAYQLDEQQGAEAIDGILIDILSIDPASVTDDDEACWLIHSAQQVLGGGERGMQIWEWAQTLAAPRMQDATMLSLLATVGASLRFGSNEELEALIDVDRLEAMFRESLDLDANIPRNFSRAGSFFLFTDQLGEAERCFARGSRLDRANTELALGLAEVYVRTDRSRDGLAVLDMCLREGGPEPEVLWRALIIAFQLEQYEAALTYIETYEELVPENPWVHHYRALALLELNRPEEALTSAEQLSQANPDCPFPAVALQASALGALGQTNEFRKHLRALLSIRLADVDYLSRSGIVHLLRRLWLATADCLPANDRLRKQLEDQLLASGTAPPDVFESVREGRKQIAGVNFYEVTIQQPLDENWPDSLGCLAGEEEWQQYINVWGVLAEDEDEARESVLVWQRRCYPLPAEIVEVTLDSEGYTDSPGVVWQGYREGMTE